MFTEFLLDMCSSEASPFVLFVLQKIQDLY